MNAILFANIALRALLLSAIGWALVRWCIRDARHRAWASLLALIIAAAAPVVMELPPSPRGAATPLINEQTLAIPINSWKPDWKISTTALLAPPAPLPTVAETPATPPWSLTEFVRWAFLAFAAGGLLIALHHCLMSLWAWRFRRGLRPLTDTEAQLVPSTSWRAALRVFDKTGNPCVVGLRRPVIAVPRGIIGAWNSRQWMWLFRH